MCSWWRSNLTPNRLTQKRGSDQRLKIKYFSQFSILITFMSLIDFLITFNDFDNFKPLQFQLLSKWRSNLTPIGLTECWGPKTLVSSWFLNYTYMVYHIYWTSNALLMKVNYPLPLGLMQLTTWYSMYIIYLI